MSFDLELEMGYTLSHDSITNKVEGSKNRKPYKDYTGDELVLIMALELRDLRKLVAVYKESLVQIRDELKGALNE